MRNETKTANKILNVDKVDNEILHSILKDNEVPCNLSYQAKSKLVNLNHAIASLSISQIQRTELRDQLKRIISEYTKAAASAKSVENNKTAEKKLDIARTQKALEPLLIDVRKLVNKYKPMTGTIQNVMVQYPIMNDYEKRALTAIILLSQE